MKRRRFLETIIGAIAAPKVSVTEFEMPNLGPYCYPGIDVARNLYHGGRAYQILQCQNKQWILVDTWKGNTLK